MDMYKVWFNHPLSGKEVYTYVFASSEEEAVKIGRALDMRYEFARKEV